MLKLRFVVAVFSVGMMVLSAGTVSGQDYPNKPIRIVSSEPGGGTDFAARMVAQGLTSSFGPQTIVDSRGALVAIETVAKAAPDGYTLLVAGGSFLGWAADAKNVLRSGERLSPISLTNTAPGILVVHPSLPVKSVKDLIALAKARPGELNYSSPSTGSAVHLSAELFNSMAGINIVRVAYRGSGPGTNALISGEVQVAFPAAGGVVPHIKSGRLKALAVTSAEPSLLFPDLPTIAATGLPGYESVVITGIYAPAKTPATLINRLNQEIVRFLKSTEAKEKFLSVGVEAVGSSPEQLAATMKSTIARLGKLINDVGIKAD